MSGPAPRVRVGEAPNPAIAFAIDPPTQVGNEAQTLQLSGWVIHPDYAVRGVALVRDGKVVARAPTDRERPRAQQAHASFPGSERPGFRLSLANPQPGEYWLEVHGDEGRRERLVPLEFSQDRHQRLLFMHIAKAAGSSVNEFLGQHFAPDRQLVHFEGSPRWRAQPPDLGAFDFLSGHIAYPALRRRLANLDQYFLVTVVREPSAQLVSHLAWIRRLAEPGEERRLHNHPEYIQEFAARLKACDFRSARSLTTLIRSLSERERALVDNCQVRYFTRPEGDWVGAEDVDAALRAAARFDRIGFADDLSGFLTRVARDMNWPAPDRQPPRENVTPDFFGLERAGVRVRRALKPLHRHDSELYAALRRRAAS